MVRCSQCNGGQKRERRESLVKIVHDRQRIRILVSRFGCKKNSLSFALHIITLMPFKGELNPKIDFSSFEHFRHSRTTI